MTEHIMMYGRGGVGTSTLVSNISAALTEAGFKVVQIGCSCVADSCSTLNIGLPTATVCDVIRKTGTISEKTVVHEGFKGISTIEIGLPDCVPNRTTYDALLEVFNMIDTERIIENRNADYVLYDISGDDAFAHYYRILSKAGAKRLFMVTSADFMSLRAANKAFSTIDRLDEETSQIPFGGLIPNGITNSFEDSFIADFAKKTATQVLGRVPRSLLVRQCELYGKTVIEAAPISNQSYYYRRLANQIFDNATSKAARPNPKTMSPELLQEWAREWADRLYALENGLVNDGAAI